MHREIKKYLSSWSKSPIRTPLLLRGPRQVGKSHSIRDFGTTDFANPVEINLELQPHLTSCFASRSPKTLCAELEVLLGIDIPLKPSTLIFIDEIQCSRDALLTLRAFKEQMPEVPVIAAGSLLEFTLQEDGAISFPVGRVTFCRLCPMSFQEFLLAVGEEKTLSKLKDATPSSPVSLPVHDRLLELVRTYFLVGGMPEAVEAYRKTQSFQQARQIHSRLMTAFVADFAKYGRRYDHRKLQQLLAAAPRLVGKRFKYSHVDPLSKARDLKTPLLDLERAGLVRLVRASHGNGVPLASEEREGIFKIQFLDIGLMLNALGTDLLSVPAAQGVFANEGALAEQFVGQELLAYSNPESDAPMYYWTRDKRGAEAEVDFLIALGDKVIPIEVKAGSTGQLRSLRQFMSEKSCPIGVRISQHPLSMQEGGILSIPLYMCGEIERLLRR